jgi:hypothetical protein
VDTKNELQVQVYFETQRNGTSMHSELVATFINEELYMQCLPTLEAEAERQGSIVTESLT